jgi:Tfp pilus assembly protein PilF
VAQYKGTTKPLPEIARELKVDAVVEGTVRRAQNRVRITAQLIRGSPEELLWAEQYEGEMEQVLSLQNSVAQAVARSIHVKLTPREQAALATRRTANPEAYEAYLKGRYLWESGAEENLKKSRELLEQAIAKDPGYAQAWAGLADTYNKLGSWGILPTRDVAPRARAAAEKALELDNTLAGPLVALAYVKFRHEWDWEGAERLCRQAIESNPNYGDAHHIYATILAAVGRTREAVAEARNAHQAEPLDVQYAWNVVWKLYLARQYGDAEEEARKLIVLNPRFTGGYITASLDLAAGRHAKAIAELRKTAEASHRGRLQLMYLAHALGVAGARAEGRTVLDELFSIARRDYIPPDYIAFAYEGLGERDQAIQWYERAVAERSMNGWILPDPQLDSIRSDPRFQNLMRKMGLQQVE